MAPLDVQVRDLLIPISKGEIDLGEHEMVDDVLGVEVADCTAAPDSGAVYVFSRVGTTWSQQAYLKASNTEADDQFGWRISLAGDTLAIGAPFEDSNATGVGGNEADNTAKDSGAAYLFTCTGTTWRQQAYLKATNTEAGDQFGVSVSLSGDMLAVGGWCEGSSATGVNGNQVDNAALYSGAVYISH